MSETDATRRATLRTSADLPAVTRYWRLIGALIITLLLLAAPYVLGGYWVRVVTVVFIFATMAQAVNIIAGYAGYPALGNAVFLGTGAYIAAIAANEMGASFALSIMLAGVGSMVFAVVVGRPILRLNGRYFLMATLGFLEITREVVLNIGVTGGAQGQILPTVTTDPILSNYLFYYLAFILVLLTTLSTWWISNNNFGMALRAIKFDEEAAQTMGINTTVYKTMAWGVSAFFTGMAGAVYAYFLAYIEPAQVFEIATSVRMYIQHVFGGAGTVLGPLLGAGIIELISETVWARFTELHYLILGILVVIVTLFFPNGLMQYLRNLRMSTLSERFGRERTSEKR